MHVLDMLAAGPEERSHTVRSGNQLLHLCFWKTTGSLDQLERQK